MAQLAADLNPYTPLLGAGGAGGVLYLLFIKMRESAEDWVNELRVEIRNVNHRMHGIQTALLVGEINRAHNEHDADIAKKLLAQAEADYRKERETAPPIPLPKRRKRDE